MQAAMADVMQRIAILVRDKQVFGSGTTSIVAMGETSLMTPDFKLITSQCQIAEA
jgi:hypothetical protein